MILSESDIRKAVKEALRFRKPKSGYSRGRGLSVGGDESINIDVPDGDYIHPIVKNSNGSTPKLGSKPDPARTITVDGVTATRPHNGYDIGMPIGYPIVSVASGKVVQAVTGSKSAGNYIVIKHDGPLVGDNNFTAYMHLSQILVKQGQKVKPGELIGKSGNTGRSTGPHLHFQIGNKRDTRKHSHNKAQYDAFFAKCKTATFSKGKVSTPDEERVAKNTSSSSTQEPSAPKVVKRSDTPIKDGITGEEYLASRVSIGSGENKVSYAQIKSDGRVFKRLKDGAPVFMGSDPTYKLVRDDEEIKKIMATA